MRNIIVALFIFFPFAAFGMGNADPVITKVMLDKFEVGKDNLLRWEASAFIGRDLQKLWVKTEGDAIKSDVEYSEFRVLYGAAIAPYWDLMVGLKHDRQPSPKSHWLELGIQGMAPYFIESSISFFVNNSVNTSLRAEFGKEFMLSQKWALESELEMNINGYNNSDDGIKSGIDNLEIGLRLHYQMAREFSPYIGVNWEKSYGKLKDEESQLVVGFMAWF